MSADETGSVVHGRTFLALDRVYYAIADFVLFYSEGSEGRKEVYLIEGSLLPVYQVVG